jgi:hypothetical protein
VIEGTGAFNIAYGRWLYSKSIIGNKKAKLANHCTNNPDRSCCSTAGEERESRNILDRFVCQMTHGLTSVPEIRSRLIMIFGLQRRSRMTTTTTTTTTTTIIRRSFHFVQHLSGALAKTRPFFTACLCCLSYSNVVFILFQDLEQHFSASFMIRTCLSSTGPRLMSLKLRCFLMFVFLTCFLQKKSLGGQLLEQVFYHLDILEKDYFGLQFTDPYNVPHWLDPSKLVKKQVKSMCPKRNFWTNPDKNRHNYCAQWPYIVYLSHIFKNYVVVLTSNDFLAIFLKVFLIDLQRTKQFF